MSPKNSNNNINDDNNTELLNNLKTDSQRYMWIGEDISSAQLPVKNYEPELTLKIDETKNNEEPSKFIIKTKVSGNFSTGDVAFCPVLDQYVCLDKPQNPDSQPEEIFWDYSFLAPANIEKKQLSQKDLQKHILIKMCLQVEDHQEVLQTVARVEVNEPLENQLVPILSAINSAGFIFISNKKQLDIKKSVA